MFLAEKLNFFQRAYATAVELFRLRMAAILERAYTAHLAADGFGGETLDAAHAAHLGIHAARLQGGCQDAAHAAAFHFGGFGLAFKGDVAHAAAIHFQRRGRQSAQMDFAHARVVYLQALTAQAVGL